MSRASYEQVEVIIEFMSNHPGLALGQNKSLEDRFESKGLWQDIAARLNAIRGARKTPKGWAKYWADKKCNVRKLAMIHGNGTGSTPPGFSPLDKRILQLVGHRDKRNSYNRFKSRVKREAVPPPEPEDEGDGDAVVYEEEHLVDYDQVDKPIEFVDRPLADTDDERHMQLMEKMLQAMTEQSVALGKMAELSQQSTLALSRLAQAAELGASALQRLADSVSGAGASLGNASSVLSDINGAVQRAFPDPLI